MDRHEYQARSSESVVMFTLPRQSIARRRVRVGVKPWHLLNPTIFISARATSSGAVGERAPNIVRHLFCGAIRIST
jgi:hypothetical protein